MFKTSTRASWLSFALSFAITAPRLAHAADAGTPPPNAEPSTESSAETPAAAPAKPLMDFSVAPPSPAAERKDYLHEGFYFRFNIGPGIAQTNVSSGGTSGSGGSFALGADLLIGGSPSPGLTLGGAAFTNINVSVPVLGTNLTQFQYIVGPFFDAYPQNKRGFHFGAGLGLAGTTLDSLPGGPAWGGGGALFTGYDVWIAPEWSAGFLIRGTGAYMGANNIDTSSFGLMALVTLLHN